MSLRRDVLLHCGGRVGLRSDPAKTTQHVSSGIVSSRSHCPPVSFVCFAPCDDGSDFRACVFSLPNGSPTNETTPPSHNAVNPIGLFPKRYQIIRCFFPKPWISNNGNRRSIPSAMDVGLSPLEFIAVADDHRHQNENVSSGLLSRTWAIPNLNVKTDATID